VRFNPYLWPSGQKVALNQPVVHVPMWVYAPDKNAVESCIEMLVMKLDEMGR
jgi:hypothetical protein